LNPYLPYLSGSTADCVCWPNSSVEVLSGVSPIEASVRGIEGLADLDLGSDPEDLEGNEECDEASEAVEAVDPRLDPVAVLR
jgi:hypothetical protein